MIALFNETRRNPSDESRYNWLYRNNPDGEAALWTIRAAVGREVMGFTVALPRSMLVDGERRTCWNGADFSIRSRFRVLGPAIKLRRAAKLAIDAGAATFLYAHPNARMAVIHAKAGHLPVGKMRRYARLLRTAPYLKRKTGSPHMATVAGAVIDPLVRLAGREKRHRFTCRVLTVSPAQFDDRYDRLFEEHAYCAKVVGVRDARYLSWRYAENPLYRTHLLEAREGDRLRAYLLFVENGGMAYIKDLFPPQSHPAVRDLLAAMIHEGYGRQLVSVNVTTLEGNPLVPLLSEFGFHRRADSTVMFAYAAERSPWREAVLDQYSWFLTEGDRDV